MIIIKLDFTFLRKNLLGSGFISSDMYQHGLFSALIKLPSDYTAGVVVAFYVSLNVLLCFFFSLLAGTLLYFTSFISTAIYMQRIEILKIVNCTFCILDDVLKLSIVLFCYDTDDKS